MDFDGLVTRFQQLLKPKRKSNDNQADPVPWNWVCSHLITLLEKYASGATEAILRSELQALWDESSEDWNESSETRIAGLNMVGDTQADGMLEVRVVGVRQLVNTHIWAVNLQDASGIQMEHYLHPRLSDLIDGSSPLLIPGRSIRLSGTRKTIMGNPPSHVLLPTQQLAVMLGTVSNVNDDHYTDPLLAIPLNQLQQFRNQECIIAAKVVGIRGTTIHLTAPSSPHVVLELTRTNQLVGRLVRKGEILRVQTRVPPTYDPHHPTNCTIEYLPGTICILANSASPNGANVESLLGGAGIRDMQYVKTQIRVRDIGPSLSGVNVLARVMLIGRNKPTQAKLNRYPLKLADSFRASHPKTVDVTVWDTGMVASLKVGMLVYAENLSSTSVKEPTANRAAESYVIASSNFSTRLRPISTLPAILTSSLFPITPLVEILSHTQSAALYLQHPTNFIVRATIQDYKTPGSEIPVYIMHSPCHRKPKRMADFTDLFECRFCNIRSHESAHEWEKQYDLEWKISDGSAECLVQATPRVSEGIMKMRASTFAELDVARQTAVFDTVIPVNYLFSVSMIQDGKQKRLRIDQLVSPNPVAETTKLLDDLTQFL